MHTHLTDTEITDLLQHRILMLEDEKRGERLRRRCESCDECTERLGAGDLETALSRGLEVFASSLGLSFKANGFMLQRATEADIPAYIALTRRVESRTYVAVTTEQGVVEELAKGPVYIIRRGDRAIGLVSYVIKPDDSAYISELVVDPEYHGKGIGRAALRFVLAEVKDIAKVWLMTHPDNAGAIHLYESTGFRQNGVRIENYFNNEPRIELVLQRDA